MNKSAVMRRSFGAAAVIAALTLSACGGSDSTNSGGAATEGSAKLKNMTKATLILDYLPNAVHAGIYRAAAAGYYADNNIDLKIIQPTSTADTLKLIDAGKADFGIADGIDVATQIDQGRGAKAIMAVVQRPLGGLISLKSEGLTDAAAFNGKTVGLTGVPSDTAILDTILENGGESTDSVKKVTIGFNGVQNLESKKINGFIGFYPADGVQVEQDGFPINVLAFDESGGPRYPGLVVFSTEKRITEDPALMNAFVDATVQGYDDTIADPAQSLDDLLAANKAMKRDITKAQLDAYLPLFLAGAKNYGVIDEANIEALSTFLVDKKLIKAPIAPSRFGTNEFVPTGN